MYGAADFPWIMIPATVVAATSLVYLVLASVAVFFWALRRKPAVGPADADLPPVSLLKPLCGDEPDLYRNLSSFCAQRYGRYQIVFGVMDAADPALETVRALQRQYPRIDMTVVVDACQIGLNRKVSNLSNMIKMAKYNHVVISDSDISVGPDYLSTVIRELQAPNVGLITCPYRGRPSGGFFSRLGAMYINEWFLPSVLVGRLLGYRRFSFGSTIAIRRDVLEALGGLSVTAGHLADDYLLGELVRRQGLRTSLSTYMVTNSINEPGFAALWNRELRWARTIRSVQPAGYAFSGITHALPICLLLLVMSGAGLLSLGLLGAAIALRVVLHLLTTRAVGTGRLWEAVFVPARDVLTFWLFWNAFVGNEISWRSNRFFIRPDGSLNVVRQEVEAP